MLYIDEYSRAAFLLRLRHNMERDRRFAGTFRPVYLDDTPARYASDTKRDIERQRAGGDRLHIERAVLPELHHRALAKLLFNLAKRSLKRLFPILGRDAALACAY